MKNENRKNKPQTDAEWESLKVGDIVLGREVVREAKDTACGWPQLTDLMSDEGTGWLVCRAGFDHPACGCPHEEDDTDYFVEEALDQLDAELAWFNSVDFKHKVIENKIAKCFSVLSKMLGDAHSIEHGGLEALTYWQKSKMLDDMKEALE